MGEDFREQAPQKKEHTDKYPAMFSEEWNKRMKYAHGDLTEVIEWLRKR